MSDPDFYRKDRSEIVSKTERLELIKEKLQEAYAREDYLPLRFPDLPEPYTQLGQRYYFNIFYANQMESSRRVGVCCLEKPLKFFLRTDGRVVILFDGEQFSAQWMTEREFRAQAKALGFDSLLAQ